MTNDDIDGFFAEFSLAGRVERQLRPPNVVWTLQAAGFPVLIQTQENANRLRIVVFIAEDSRLDGAGRDRLLAASYHSALDARYALADGAIVSAFLHPLHELTRPQFVLGFYQAVSCAETYGGEFSGGTLNFGAAHHGGNGAPRAQGDAERGIVFFTEELVKKIGK